MCITSCGTKSAASSDNPQEDSPSVTEQYQPDSGRAFLYLQQTPRHARRIKQHRAFQESASEITVISGGFSVGGYLGNEAYSLKGTRNEYCSIELQRRSCPL